MLATKNPAIFKSRSVKSKYITAILVVLILLMISYLSSLFISDGIQIGDKIAIIPIKGLITVEGADMPFQGEGTSSDKIISYLEEAEKSDDIKAIILEINSPGGGIVASSEIAKAVKTTKKPVVAWIREIGASGAYWIASAADVIIADPMSITGSIGVVSSYLQFSDLMEDYGITYERLVAGEYKDTGSIYKPLTGNERVILQSKLALIQDEFIKEVAENRNLDEKTTKELSKATFYLGIEAYNLGLVDKLGNKALVMNITKDLAKVEKANLVRLEEKKRLMDLLSRISAYSFYFLGKGIAENLKLNQDLQINAA